MKRYARALGVDDGFFTRDQEFVQIFGVLMRGEVVEAALVRTIHVDGTDATSAILSMLESRVGRQARVLFLNGAVLGGTNVVDPEEIPIPLISIVRRKPTEKFYEALLKSPHGKEKVSIARKYVWKRVSTPKGPLWVSSTEPEAIKYVLRYQINSAVPEPLRLAHIFATAVTLGESRGHA